MTYVQTVTCAHSVNGVVLYCPKPHDTVTNTVHSPRIVLTNTQLLLTRSSNPSDFLVLLAKKHICKTLVLYNRKSNDKY